MVFLRGHNVSAAYAQKIYKAYGANSIQKVSENPYALAKEVFGIGFKTADHIAEGLGISKDSPIRIDAGIEHAFWELATMAILVIWKKNLSPLQPRCSPAPLL